MRGMSETDTPKFFERNSLNDGNETNEEIELGVGGSYMSFAPKKAELEGDRIKQGIERSRKDTTADNGCCAARGGCNIF